METNELSKNARGGTELMLERLHRDVNTEGFQIIPTRVRDLYPDKLRVYWCHDLVGDPEVNSALGNGGWKRFHGIVFVSTWQAQMMTAAYGIPWSRVAVIKNAIERPGKYEITNYRTPSDDEPVRLVYTPTPHRGLDILTDVFEKVADELNLTLDVFSSFKLYGWEQRDEQYKELFARLDANPRVTNHRSQPNSAIRACLADSHIFAYPSTWQETSCLCLIEALCYGLYCVHPNLAALDETSQGWSEIYDFTEDKAEHAKRFEKQLRIAVERVRGGDMDDTFVYYHIEGHQNYYDWEYRVEEWDDYLNGLRLTPPLVSNTQNLFSYEVH